MRSYLLYADKWKKTLTLQCFKASLYSLFLMASLAFFSSAFTSLLDIFLNNLTEINVNEILAVVKDVYRYVCYAA